MYTKGKWKVLPEGKEWIVDEEGFSIARIIDGKGKPFNKANAHLIAAAPDMYEALKDIYDFLKSHGYRTDIVREALTEAEGKWKRITEGISMSG